MQYAQHLPLDMMTLDDEKQFVERAQADPGAFSVLYEAYYDSILNYVIRRTGNVDVAKDVVSETFYRALRSLRMFQWRSIPFSAWLYRIATNEVNQYLRKSRYVAESFELMIERSGREPQMDYDLEDEVIRAQEEVDRHKQFLAIQQEIARLPLKYQEVLVLRFFESKTLKDIGIILGKSEGTVKSLLHRGIERLKRVTSSQTSRL